MSDILSLGFTGTQSGMSSHQMEKVNELVMEFCPVEVHHGDCIGADAQFHDMCQSLDPRPQIHVHPPEIKTKRAFKKGDVMHPELPYLMRNDEVACRSNVLIATPKGYMEEMRSGTWSTIRRARRRGIDTYIVFPDGTVRKDQ